MNAEDNLARIDIKCLPSIKALVIKKCKAKDQSMKQWLIEAIYEKASREEKQSA